MIYSSPPKSPNFLFANNNKLTNICRSGSQSILDDPVLFIFFFFGVDMTGKIGGTIRCRERQPSHHDSKPSETSWEIYRVGTEATTFRRQLHTETCLSLRVDRKPVHDAIQISGKNGYLFIFHFPFNNKKIKNKKTVCSCRRYL